MFSFHRTIPAGIVYTLRQIAEEDEASRIMFATYYALDSTGSVRDKLGHYVRNNGCMQRSNESLKVFACAEYAIHVIHEEIEALKYIVEQIITRCLMMTSSS